jgi:hypothetical protein
MLNETKTNKKTNGIRLIGDGRDMTSNLAENQGYKHEGSPAKDVQVQLKRGLGES